jgi:hypothetical protein
MEIIQALAALGDDADAHEAVAGLVAKAKEALAEEAASERQDMHNYCDKLLETAKTSVDELVNMAIALGSESTWPGFNAYLESVGMTTATMDDIYDHAEKAQDLLAAFTDEWEEFKAGYEAKERVLAAFPEFEVKQINLMLPDHMAYYKGEEVPAASGTSEWEVWEALAELLDEGKLPDPDAPDNEAA